MTDGRHQKLVLVDIGNHRIKFGAYAAEDSAEGIRSKPPADILHVATGSSTFDELDLWLAGAPAQWCVATVHRAAETRLADWVASRRPSDAYRCLTNRDLPIEIDVHFPERVGTDRLLAAVAVNELRDALRPAVIVDAGTAITVDAVSADGVFRGGVILPGFSLVARALALAADQLPLVEGSLAEQPPSVIGKSTEAAIRSGLFWGNVGAVRELVDRMTKELGQPPQLFFAGGDAARLAPLIAAEAQIVPELVFHGMLIAHRKAADLPPRP